MLFIFKVVEKSSYSSTSPSGYNKTPLQYTRKQTKSAIQYYSCKAGKFAFFSSYHIVLP